MDIIKGIVDALKLPTKTKAAIALASGALWILFSKGTLSIPDWDKLLTPLFLISTIFAGIAVTVDIFEWLARPITLRRQRTLSAARRGDREREQNEAWESRKDNILKRINYLSKGELALVLKSLDGKSPSIKTWVHNPDAASLMHKHLLECPGGVHHGDYFPFVFPDFVWEEIILREDDLRSRYSELNGD